MDVCQATYVRWMSESLEPEYPSNSSVNERQLMVVRETPFVVILRYEGLIDSTIKRHLSILHTSERL